MKAGTTLVYSKNKANVIGVEWARDEYTAVRSEVGRSQIMVDLRGSGKEFGFYLKYNRSHWWLLSRASRILNSGCCVENRW